MLCSIQEPCAVASGVYFYGKVNGLRRAVTQRKRLPVVMAYQIGVGGLAGYDICFCPRPSLAFRLAQLPKVVNGSCPYLTFSILGGDKV